MSVSPRSRPEMEPDSLSENRGVQLVMGVSLILLVFAGIFLVVDPNREHPSFSEVSWVTHPVFVRGAPISAVDFSIQLSAHERDSTTYRVSVFIEGHPFGSQNLTLNPGERQIVPFHVPYSFSLLSWNEVRVRVTRASKVPSKGDDFPLEIVDGFSAPLEK